MPTSSYSNSRNQWTHFHCNLWVATGLVLILGQIIAAVVVLSVSRDEKPHTPLLAWVLVYMASCVATLPHIYWNWHETRVFNTSTLKGMDIFAIVLLCFYYVWFAVGCVWIRNASSSHAPNLYRLCVVFLTTSGVFWVVLPLIIVVHFCYRLLRIIYLARLQNTLKGASQEYINALPMHTFKSKDNATSGDDEACCICLTKYVDGDKLRELVHCSHLFHTECVDKWLKKNASCPLCKHGIEP